MAENSTSSDETSGWDSMLKSDQGSNPVAVDSGSLTSDSKAQEVEPSGVSAHTSSGMGNMDVRTESTNSEIATSTNAHEQAAATATESNNPLTTDETSHTDTTTETPIENGISKSGGGNETPGAPSAPAPAKEEAPANNHPDQEKDGEVSPDHVFEEPALQLAEGEESRSSDPWDNISRGDGDEDGKDNDNASGASGDDGQGVWSKDSGDNDNAEDDFFSQLKTQTKPIYVPPETDSRFEEGVPLLETSPQSPAKTTFKPKHQSRISQIFTGNDDEAGGFFSAVQQSKTTEEPPSQPPSHLTRKSTSQVIDSVGGAQHSPISETSPMTPQFNTLTPDSIPQKEVKKASSEEDLAARWQEALDDEDDDLLLEEEVGDDAIEGQHPVPVPANNEAPAGLGSPFGSPQSSATVQTQSNSYVPHQPSTSELLQGPPMPGIAQASTAPTPSYFAPRPQLNATAGRAESFAERSKEGYKSPYDLPEGLTRPRRPIASQKPVTAAGPASAAPPRSSSIAAPPTTSMPPVAPPPPSSMPYGSPPPAVAAPPPKNFYGELPMPPPKPRPASSARYTPDSSAVAPGLSVPPPPANQYANITSSPQTSTRSFADPPMQQPGRLDSHAGSMLAPNPPAIPNATSRYSPKPPGLQDGIKPPPSPRYSPAPPPSSAAPPRNRYASQAHAPPGHGAALPFQPRTSSPLAYHEKSSYQPQAGEEHPATEPPTTMSPPDRLHPRQSIDHGFQSRRPSGDGADAVIADAATSMPPSMYQQQVSPPSNQYAPPSYVNDFSQRLAPITSSPQAFPTSASRNMALPDEPQLPPRRSQTQSPGKQQMRAPGLSTQSVESFQRPASAHGPTSPIKEVSPYAPSQVSARNRAASQHLHFVPPNDEQQLDSLERWKGAPLVAFGFGGSVISCFPKHIPRYIAGQAAPMIKSSPGEVKVSQLKDWIPATESIVQHPGPLKAKSKKKDLLAWLSSKIAAFENEGLSEAVQLHPDSDKRHDEKILLWKIVRIMVENDGAMEGSESLQTSLRNVIFPEFQTPDADQAFGIGFPGSGAFQQSGSPPQPDTIDPQFVENLRNDLAKGDRDKAVWGAVDNRLWGHAMVLASTLDKSVWKQVVQEFVRREVRSTAGNTESLAALYEIFAGNADESIDELVPPSARAGLQMISKVNGSGPAKNALEGLDRWRDTLGLVLSNRSPEDHNALLALGRLLSSYGRTEAAHICYIFSRVSVFGGPDDPQANIVLLGADHQRFPSTFSHDEDSILLTEAYEYAITVLGGSPTATLPHLLSFKLLYAMSLADRGRKSEALHYCDSIAAALRATTRPSGYYHQHLFSEVGDLSARLRQTTSDGGSSWISKPSMEKVSGSMWARFNSFVSGEDSDAASTGSGKGGDGDIGPFAKISGTPTVSRSPSVSDFYGSYPSSGAQPQPMPASVPSRYHPNNQYAPNSSPEQFRGRSSLDSQRSFGTGFGQRRSSREVSPPTDGGLYQGGPFYSSPSAAGYQSTPPQSSHMPLAPVEEDMAFQAQPEFPYVPSQGPSVDGMSYNPPVSAPHAFEGSFHDQGPSSVSHGGDTGYMPPTTASSYEPPGAETLSISTPGSKQDPTDEVPYTKKPMVDDEDDDDIAARAAAVQKQEKQRKDQEADEAFRKAAEEDGKLIWHHLAKSVANDIFSYSQETSTTEEIVAGWLVWRW